MNESTLKPFCSLLVEVRADEILRYKSNLWGELKLTLEQAIQGGNLHLDNLLTSGTLLCIIVLTLEEVNLSVSA